MSSAAPQTHFSFTDRAAADEIFGAMVASCPDLRKVRSVKFYQCDAMNTPVVDQLAAECPNLECVEFYQCPNLSTGSFLRLFNECQGLTSFTCCANDAAASIICNSELVKILARRCTGLRKLCINEEHENGVDAVTDIVLKALADNCPDLEELSLGWAGKITDDGVGKLALRCRKLTRVDFLGCHLLTDMAVRSIASNCPELRELKLRPWSVYDKRSGGFGSTEYEERLLFTHEAMAFLATSHPSLTEVWVQWEDKRRDLPPLGPGPYFEEGERYLDYYTYSAATSRYKSFAEDMWYTYALGQSLAPPSALPSGRGPSTAGARLAAPPSPARSRKRQRLDAAFVHTTV